jgi:hypothetical protein
MRPFISLLFVVAHFAFIASYHLRAIQPSSLFTEDYRSPGVKFVSIILLPLSTFCAYPENPPVPGTCTSTSPYHLSTLSIHTIYPWTLVPHSKMQYCSFAISSLSVTQDSTISSARHRRTLVPNFIVPSPYRVFR